MDDSLHSPELGKTPVPSVPDNFLEGRGLHGEHNAMPNPDVTLVQWVADLYRIAGALVTGRPLPDHIARDLQLEAGAQPSSPHPDDAPKTRLGSFVSGLFSRKEGQEK